MTAQVTLEHLFTRTARAFGVRPSDMRQRRAIPKVQDARLAFCRLAVEAHGGRIWVDDAPGGGARFNLTLPQAEAVGKAENTTDNAN